jgi:hypothetical protein
MIEIYGESIIYLFLYEGRVKMVWAFAFMAKSVAFAVCIVSGRGEATVEI